MRTATVEVPADVIVEFAAKLSSSSLDNRISGATEDGEVEIEIFYERHEAREIDKLEEYLQELIDNLPDEDEEEEEDED